MGRPRRISDEQILTAMRESVLALGPNVSLDAVAEKLDVSVPALLKRFGTRRALMLAALRPPEPTWVHFVSQGPGDGPLEAQLQEIFQRISEFFAEAIPCMSALRESGIPPTEFIPADGPKRGLKTLQKWLALAREQGLVTAPETDTIAFAMLGALQSRAFFSHIMAEPISARDWHTYTRELACIFSRALRPVDSSTRSPPHTRRTP